MVVQGPGPGPRYGHVMALVGQRFLLTIGGNDGRNLLMRLSCLDYIATCRSFPLTDVDSKTASMFQENGPWQMYGPLILRLSHMNGENLSRKVKGHHHACKCKCPNNNKETLAILDS